VLSVESGSFAVVGGSAKMYQTHKAVDSSAEARLDSLERNVTLIHERISQTQKEWEEELHKTNESLKREEQSRQAEDNEIRKKLEATETGGVHISAIGASWLFVGIILSTAAPEIASLLN
jgi:hypothetical protein